MREDPWLEFVRRASEEPGPWLYYERCRSPDRPGASVLLCSRPVEELILQDPDDLRTAQRWVERATSKEVIGGFLGFDLIGFLEPLLAQTTPRGSPFPPGHLFRFSRVRRLRREGPAAGASASVLGPLEVSSPQDSASPERFQASVERIRQDILQGEAFQVVLAHRRQRRRHGTLLPLLDRLRRHERYSAAFYIRGDDGGGWEVAGASPESVVEVHHDRMAINPIAGTRPVPLLPRGSHRRLPLSSDPKELCEHRMLVDLARNDVGRVSEGGTVRLTHRETLVRYQRVEHMVSRVVGRLRSDRSAWDAFVAAFPAGTVSGAPKIRATTLLRREERTWRGPYAGAVGVFTGRRQADLTLAIRTAFASGPHVYTAAGAGVVHQSDPRQEWEETLHKLATVEGALEWRPGFR
jgi:anthranilate/para-aminobenzoate synthase component I